MIVGDNLNDFERVIDWQKAAFIDDEIPEIKARIPQKVVVAPASTTAILDFPEQDNDNAVMDDSQKYAAINKPDISRQNIDKREDHQFQPHQHTVAPANKTTLVGNNDSQNSSQKNNSF